MFSGLFGGTPLRIVSVVGVFQGFNQTGMAEIYLTILTILTVLVELTVLTLLSLATVMTVMTVLTVLTVLAVLTEFTAYLREGTPLQRDSIVEVFQGSIQTDRA